MSWLKRALWSATALLALAAPASAQVAGRPIELSGGAGLFSPDARARTKSGPAYNGAIGWRLWPGLTLEGQATFGPSEADTTPNPKHNFSMMGLDLRWNLLPPYGRAVPFMLFGAGYGVSHGGGRAPEKLERGAATLGIGLLQNVLDQRCYLRFQARDMMFRERAEREFSHHLAVTAGLQWNLLGKERDQDLDKVRDWLDRCPDTPIGARVDANGCPSDGDGDGVFDGLDRCENTPRGCKIDRDGCPTDEDGDGVCDGLDQCLGTKRGAIVDAHGCGIDSDGDGVLDGLDKCGNTPKGCTIDSTGCPADGDGDGVCDGLDHCPYTPAGLKVDEHGCPIEVNEKEVQLIETGTIRLSNIQFDTRKAIIKPESFAVLDTVGMILVQYPTLKIEIGGHTDNRGTEALNDTLSQSRAYAVLNYMRVKYPQLASDQYTAKGYGFSRPVAPNSTDRGRALNRRVEFKVLNTEALRIERERRRYLEKGETPPPPGAPPQVVPAPSVPPPSVPAPSVPPPSAPPDTSHTIPPATPQAAPPDTTKH